MAIGHSPKNATAREGKLHAGRNSISYVRQGGPYRREHQGTSMHLPFGNLDIHALPPPLSTALARLVLDGTEAGLANAAADTAIAIECWFRTVGALLLAEYMDAGAPDDNVNRRVFEALGQKRPPPIGHLVATAQRCQTVLRNRDPTGHPAIWPALEEISLGAPDERSHPVTRLLKFRNSFSHGSFARAATEIRDHRVLLEQQIRIVSGNLSERPLRFQLPTGESCILRGAHPSRAPAAHTDQPRPSRDPFVPYVVLPDGSVRVVGPTLQVAARNDEWVLGLGRLDPQASAAGRPFGDALERYRREAGGHVQFGDLVPRRSDSRGHDVRWLDDGLATQTVTLVEYRPGTGQAGLAARLLSALEAVADPARIWRVVPDHPGSSGVAFGRSLLRLAEEALGQQPQGPDPVGAELLDAILASGSRLMRAHKKVGVVVMDAGAAPGAGTQEPRLADIFGALSRNAASGYRLVLLAHPTAELRVPHGGAVLHAPLPASDGFDSNELATVVRAWRTRHGVIADVVLRCVLDGCASTPVSVVALAELIEARGENPVFPPAVEHALWTATPLLERHRDLGDERLSSWIPGGGVGGTYAAAISRALGIQRATAP